METSIRDNSSALYKQMLDACNKYDPTDNIQIGLLGFKIRDKTIYDTRSYIMPAVQYAQKRMTDFASKTKNALNVGPSDGIIGKMTITAGKKYLETITNMRLLLGTVENMSITPTFDDKTNMYNSVVMPNAILFENSSFNKDILIDQNILNGTPRPLVKRQLSKITQIVVHESVANDTESTVNILRHRGFSTHFIINTDDKGCTVISQCAPIDRVCWHINSCHNSRSIGIDIVNPYYPGSVLKSSPFRERPIINSKFTHGGKYVVPFDNQIVALFKLVKALGTVLGIDFVNSICEASSDNVVFHAPANGALKDRMSGVISHWSIGGHADGILPVYQLWRLATGRDIDWNACE